MRVVTWAVVAVTLARPVIAVADDRPWAAGISDAQKAQARTLLDEGNQLFLEKKYAPALEKYRAAVGVWNHPAIRFNMVRCEIQLDRPVDASDDLALALAYGAAPLEQAVYNEALSYQKLLANQIGQLNIRCDQPGVKVTLDGQPLLDCPGTANRRVAPGQHELVGIKEGFLTKQTEVVVLGARSQDASIALVPLGQAAKIVHRYPGWLPWTVFGGGLVVAGLGGVFRLQANSSRDAYDKAIFNNCGLDGCALVVPDPNDMTKTIPNPAIPTNLVNDARLYNRVAIALAAAGLATTIVGGVMLYLNRGRTVYEGGSETIAPAISIVPTRDGGGLVSLSGSF